MAIEDEVDHALERLRGRVVTVNDSAAGHQLTGRLMGSSSTTNGPVLFVEGGAVQINRQQVVWSAFREAVTHPAGPSGPERLTTTPATLEIHERPDRRLVIAEKT